MPARRRSTGCFPRIRTPAKTSSASAGASTRSWGRGGGGSCTSTCLPSASSCCASTTREFRDWEDRAIRYGWPLALRFARRRLGIRPGIEAEDEAAVWRELDFVAELLADGRPHLCGERFGAADLTFAALSAAVVVPPVYGVPLPQPDVLPPHTAALVERVREHPAGRYALALFTERRRECVV